MGATGLNRQLLGYRSLLAESDQGSLIRCDAVANEQVRVLTLFEQAEQSVQALLAFDPLQSLTPATETPATAGPVTVQPARKDAHTSARNRNARSPASRGKPVAESTANERRVTENPATRPIETAGPLAHAGPFTAAAPNATGQRLKPIREACFEHGRAPRQMQNAGLAKPQPETGTGASPLHHSALASAVARQSERTATASGAPLATATPKPMIPASLMAERQPSNGQGTPMAAVTSDPLRTTTTSRTARNGKRASTPLAPTLGPRREQGRSHTNGEQTTPANPLAGHPKPTIPFSYIPRTKIAQRLLATPATPPASKTEAGPVQTPYPAASVPVQTTQPANTPGQRPPLRGLSRTRVAKSGVTIKRPQTSQDAMDWHNMGYELGVDLT
ncbi:MAG: hypothetical protein LAT63_10550 [Marinobacter sp.]|nr:hypothetical protein [Marinobacter sp.]